MKAEKLPSYGIPGLFYTMLVIAVCFLTVVIVRLGLMGLMNPTADFLDIIFYFFS